MSIRRCLRNGEHKLLPHKFCDKKKVNLTHLKKIKPRGVLIGLKKGSKENEGSEAIGRNLAPDASGPSSFILIFTLKPDLEETEVRLLVPMM